MSISHLPEVKAIHKMLLSVTTDSGGKRSYTNDIRAAVLDLHYKNGITILVICREFAFTRDLIYRWKNLYGKDQTAYTFGKTIRFDVRTKCLAVKELMETTIPPSVIAVKYSTTPASLYAWKNKFADKYQRLIDTLPDGVPYLVKEEKMIYGKKNIDEVRKLLQSQSDALSLILNTMHMTGSDKKLFTSMKAKVDATTNDIKKAEDVFRQAGIIL